jgi:hypothetical protein
MPVRVCSSSHVGQGIRAIGGCASKGREYAAKAFRYWRPIMRKSNKPEDHDDDRRRIVGLQERHTKALEQIAAHLAKSITSSCSCGSRPATSRFPRRESDSRRWVKGPPYCHRIGRCGNAPLVACSDRHYQPLHQRDFTTSRCRALARRDTRSAQRPSRRPQLDAARAG